LAYNGWAIGVWLLLVALILWYANLIPKFGAFQMSSIGKNSLPLIYLAIGQAVIVIGGGIDLSLGALLLLTNTIAARFMDGQPLVIVILVALATIALMALLNGLVGYIINRSGVPDIVVTLATSYIWSGLALWVLPSPGGGTAPEMRWLFTGSTSGIGGNYFVPILMGLIPAVIVYYISRRTRLGLSIYALGVTAWRRDWRAWMSNGPNWPPMPSAGQWPPWPGWRRWRSPAPAIHALRLGPMPRSTV
jgi:ribose transport system permease protein